MNQKNDDIFKIINKFHNFIRSAFARRRGGDMFEYRPDTAS